MMTWLTELLLRLNARERGLLALLGLTLILGLIFGGLLPLYDQRQAAQTARLEATALERWVTARVVEKTTLTRGISPIPQDPVGLSRLEQGLISARLRPQLSALTRQGDSGLTLQFDQVDFLRLARWLSAAHPAWGYHFKSFRFEALKQPGQIAAWIALHPAQP